MNRHLRLTISASIGLLAVGCVSTGELNEEIARVQRENVRTMGVLEHRVADLQQQLADAQRSALQTIQEEALVRGQETLTLKEQLEETEAFLTARLASQTRETTAARRALGNIVANIKRDLSARLDIEAMAHIDDQRKIRENAVERERSIEERIEAIATSRQQDRDQVTEAIARLDRETTIRLQTEQNTREHALAQLGGEMQGLHEQTLTAIADARRATQDAEAALYTQLAENNDALLDQISTETKARMAQAIATTNRLDQEAAIAIVKLKEISAKLARLPKPAHDAQLAERATSSNASKTETRKQPPVTTREHVTTTQTAEP